MYVSALMLSVVAFYVKQYGRISSLTLLLEKWTKRKTQAADGSTIIVGGFLVLLISHWEIPKQGLLLKQELLLIA